MKLNALLLVATASVALTACDAAKEAVGIGKNPPDEFQVCLAGAAQHAAGFQPAEPDAGRAASPGRHGLDDGPERPAGQ